MKRGRRRAARKATPPAKKSRKSPPIDPGAELAHLAAVLADEPDERRALEHLLTSCRRVTRAEAGTVYVRRGHTLEFAVIQNDVLDRQLGADEVRRRVATRPLALGEASIASYVVLTRSTVNLPDAYAIPRDVPYTLFREIDRKADYTTVSMLALPLRDARQRVFGVLQLINALDARRRVRAFSKEHQAVVQMLAALAARIPQAVAAG